MSVKAIPESHRGLISDEKPAFGYLATTMKDGTPQVTPIWFNIDGDQILINSAKGRVKDKNMRARPQVALVIHDPEDPYRYILIRGMISEISEEGARQHINDLAKKYTNQPVFHLKDPNEIRVTYKLTPQKIHVSG
ncbi:MAG: PPOX class F420-dependent oxidoreductase [Chloroflexota bacterium]|nr:MAG: PPOX class F420-dependent oxidoreductase [Chloroflexota bacterium]